MRLKAVYRALDSLRLLNQLESLQEALCRHAVFQSRGRSAITDLVAQFDLKACGGAGDEATGETIMPFGRWHADRRTESQRDRAYTGRVRIRSKPCGMRCARG